jgi:hypothetical protein
MFNSLFMLQGAESSPVTFGPVIETHAGKGEEPFLTDYPSKTLVDSDLELVPWMVGIMAKEGGLFPESETTVLRYIK